MSVVQQLRESAFISRNKIAVTKKSLSERYTLTKKVNDLKETDHMCDLSIEHLKQVQSKLIKYNNKKKENSMSGIYSSIYTAKSIIPDTADLTMSYDKNMERLKIVNDKGVTIDNITGCGFKELVSLLIRIVTLRNSDYILTLFLDESLFGLSPDNSAKISKYLNILAKNVQLIMIEQKNEIFTDVEGPVYTFNQIEGVTYIEKEGESDEVN